MSTATPLSLVDVEVTCPGVVDLEAQLSPLFTVYPVCTEPLTLHSTSNTLEPTNTESRLATLASLSLLVDEIVFTRGGLNEQYLVDGDFWGNFKYL